MAEIRQYRLENRTNSTWPTKMRPAYWFMSKRHKKSSSILNEDIQRCVLVSLNEQRMQCLGEILRIKYKMQSGNKERVRKKSFASKNRRDSEILWLLPSVTLLLAVVFNSLIFSNWLNVAEAHEPMNSNLLSPSRQTITAAKDGSAMIGQFLDREYVNDYSHSQPIALQANQSTTNKSSENQHQSSSLKLIHNDDKTNPSPFSDLLEEDSEPNKRPSSSSRGKRSLEGTTTTITEPDKERSENQRRRLMLSKQHQQQRILFAGDQQQPPGELLFSNQTGAIAYCGIARELGQGLELTERQQLQIRAGLGSGQQQQSTKQAKQFDGSTPLSHKNGQQSIVIRWEKENGDQVEQVIYAEQQFSSAQQALQSAPSDSSQHAHHQLALKRPLRYIRASDGALIFEPFAANEYRPDLHATTYRCVASLAQGPARLVSRDMRVRAIVIGGGGGNSNLQAQSGPMQPNSAGGSQIEVLDELVLEGNSATFKCLIPAHASAYMQLLDWIEYPSETIHTVQSTQFLKLNSQLYDHDKHSNRSSLVEDPTSSAAIQQLASAKLSIENRHFVHPKTGDLHILNVRSSTSNLPTSAAGNSQNYRSYKCRCKNKLSGELVSSFNRAKLTISESRAPLAPRISTSSSSSLSPFISMPARFRSSYSHPDRHQTAIQQLSKLSYIEGSRLPAVLVCQLQAYPKAEINWFKRMNLIGDSDSAPESGSQNEASLIPLNTNLSGKKYIQMENLLLIRNINRTDAGQYVCQARNGVGEERIEMDLAVRAPLRVQLQASAQLLELGKSLALECRVSGFPLHQVTFRHNGQVIKSIDGMQVVAASKESPSSLTTSRGFGSTSSASSEQNYFIVSEDGSAQFDQEASLSSSSKEDDRMLSKQTEEQIIEASAQPEADSTSHVIVIMLEPQQAGGYQCFAENQYEQVQSSQFIQVLDDPPKFRDTFVTQVHNRGDDISLLCSVHANPIAEITWSIDERALEENRRVRIGDFVTRDNLVVSYVNISQADVLDSALYKCTADNGLAQISHEAQVSVRGGPLVKPMLNVTVLASTTFRQRCPVAGFPIGEVQWHHQGKRLPQNHRQHVYENGTLEVEHMERSAGDEGEYVCVVMPPPTATGSTGSADSASMIGGELSASNSNNNKAIQQPALASNSLHVNIRVRPTIEPFSISRALREGQRASVMCTISSGDLPISISWFRNGRPLLSVASQSDPFSGDIGQQQLVVIEQQQDSSNSSSSTASNSPVPLQGVRIQRVSDYSSTLLFESLLGQHSANYTCLARNEAGSVSHQAPMIVQVAPKWHIEPSDTNVVHGASTSIDCMASGFPPPRIIWTKANADQLGNLNGQQQSASSGGQQQSSSSTSPKDGQRPASHHLGAWRSIVSSPHLQVFENGSLNILDARDSDFGHYMCQASNGVGAGLSKVIQITINVAAQFQQTRHAIQFVARGEQAHLKCQAKGDWPTSLLWLRNSRYRLDPINVLETQPQQQQQQQQQLPLLLSSSTSSLLANPINGNLLTGSQTKLASGKFLQSASSESQLWWASSSANQAAEVSGSQAPKNGLLLPGYTLVTSEYLQPSRNTGKSAAELAQLVVDLKAQRRQMQQQPQLTASDLMLNEQLANNSWPQQEHPIVVQVVSVLSIQHVERQDTSTFKCLAMNQFGFDERTIQLVVQEPPDHIEELSVLEVNSRSITLGWLAPYDGNSPITQYHVQYRAIPLGSNAHSYSNQHQLLSPSFDPAAKTNTSATRSNELSNLGWFNYTLVVTNGLNDGGTTSSNGDQHQAQDTIHHHGYLASATATSSSTMSSTATVSAGRSLMKITINLLRPVTRYWFRVEPENKLGRGPMSNIVESVTMEEAPSSAPSKLKALAQSSSSILVSWSKLTDKETFGSVQGYYVAYRPVLESTSDGNSSEQMTPSQELADQSGISTSAATSIYKTIQNDEKVNKFDALLTNLKRQTRYMISVQAFNARGTGPSSEPVLVKTLELDPPRQLKLFVKQTTNCSIQIEWRPQSQAALAKQHQQLDQGEQPSMKEISLQQQQQHQQDADVVDYYSLYQAELNEQPQWQETRLAGHATSHIIEDLKCGTRYQFYMMGVNRIGIGDQSEILDTKTAGNSPIAPDWQSTFDVINATCYIVRLDHWQDNGCPIRRFNVRYRPESSREWIPLAHFELQHQQHQETTTTTSPNAVPTQDSPSEIITGSGVSNLRSAEQQMLLNNNLYDDFYDGAPTSRIGHSPSEAGSLGLALDPMNFELPQSSRPSSQFAKDIYGSTSSATRNSIEQDSPFQDDDAVLDYSMASAAALETLDNNDLGDSVSADYLALEAAAMVSKDSPTSDLEQIEEQVSLRQKQQQQQSNKNQQQLFILLKDSMIPTFDEQQSLTTSTQSRIVRRDAPSSKLATLSPKTINQHDKRMVNKMPQPAQEWQASNFIMDTMDETASSRVRQTSSKEQADNNNNNWRRVRLCNLAENLYYTVQIRSANRVGETEAELRLLTNQDGLEYDPILKRHVVGRLGGRNNPSPPPETGGALDRMMAHSVSSLNGGLGMFAYEQWPMLVPVTLSLTTITVVIIIMLLLKKSPKASPGSTSSAATTTTSTIGVEGGNGCLGNGSSTSGVGGNGSNCSSSGYIDDVTPLNHHHHQHQQHNNSVNHHFATLHHLPSHGHSYSSSHHHHLSSIGTLKPHHLHHYHNNQPQTAPSAITEITDNSADLMLGASAMDNYATIGQIAQPSTRCLIGPKQDHADRQDGASSPTFTDTNLAKIYQQRSALTTSNQQTHFNSNHDHQQLVPVYGCVPDGGGGSIDAANSGSFITSSLMTTTQAQLDSNGNSLVDTQTSSSTNRVSGSPTTTAPSSSLNSGSTGGHQQHQSMLPHNVHLANTLPHHHHHLDSRGVNVYLCSKQDESVNSKEQETAIFYNLASSLAQQQTGQQTGFYGDHHVQLRQRYQTTDLNQQQDPSQQQAMMMSDNNDGSAAALNERLIFDPVYATIRRTLPQAFKYLTLQLNNQQQHVQPPQQSQPQPSQQQQQQQQLSQQSDIAFFDSGGN